MIIDAFKIYMKDTRFLISIMESEVGIAILDGDMVINQGAIVENITADIISKKSVSFSYFGKKCKLEVDFVLNIKGIVIAVEIKLGNNRQSKSLDVLMYEKYKVQRGIKLEKSNIFVDDAGVEHDPPFTIEFLM